MRTINSGFGVFYCEDLKERSEEDRLKFYDSDNKYVGYLGLESFEAEDDESLIKLLEVRVGDYENTEDISGVLSDLEEVELITTDVNFLADLLELSVDDVVNNEYVNHIGDFYILTKE